MTGAEYIAAISSAGVLLSGLGSFLYGRRATKAAGAAVEHVQTVQDTAAQVKEQVTPKHTDLTLVDLVLRQNGRLDNLERTLFDHLRNHEHEGANRR